MTYPRKAMRLQKFLALAGIASRRQSEELILKGAVKVNKRVIKKLGTKVDPDKDRVEYKNQLVSLPTEFLYYVVYKPQGYTTTLQDRYADKIVTDLLPADLPRLVPVGRLDKESEGLLVMTNDGALVNRLTHPSFEHEKEYVVTVQGHLKKSQLGKIRSGLKLDQNQIKRINIEKIDRDPHLKQTTYRLTLREGQKRQIRRIFGKFGLAVVKLVRTRMANLRLEGLKSGGYRKIAKNDILKND